MGVKSGLREGSGHSPRGRGARGHRGCAGAAGPGHRRCAVPAAARGGGSVPGGGGQRAPTWAVCDRGGGGIRVFDQLQGHRSLHGPPHSLRGPHIHFRAPVHFGAAHSLQPPSHRNPNHCRGTPLSLEMPLILCRACTLRRAPHSAQSSPTCAEPPNLRRALHPAQSPPPFIEPP